MAAAMTRFVDTIILGAGAAGLMVAIAAGEHDPRHSVLLLEANAKPGMKILISGGGRCNFTNLDVRPSHYVSGNPHFCKSALAQFSPHDFIAWVKDAGIEHYEKTLGQLFCKHSSKEIVNLLLGKCASASCELRTAVRDIVVTKDGEGFCVRCSAGSFTCRNLVVATGGLAGPQLGATSLGYEIAQQFGHTITELSPALDGFDLGPHHTFSTLSGVSLVAQITTPSMRFTEDVLFTHKGLSGPVALKASLYWHQGEALWLDLAPQVADFVGWLHEMRNAEGKKTVRAVLAHILPNRLAGLCCDALNIHLQHVARLSKADGQKLTAWIKAHKLTPRQTIGYAKAEVTRGGVATDEVHSGTMESQRVPGLFFVGEVLDVTGWLGGYNFQWAWSSGWVAGHNLR